MKNRTNLSTGRKFSTSTSPFCLLLFCALLFCALPCAAQPKTLFECNFEKWTNGRPDGWNFCGDITLPSGQENLIPTVSQVSGYTGSYACKVEGVSYLRNGASNTTIFHPRLLTMRFTDSTKYFPIYWGKKYVLTFTAKRIGGFENCPMHFIIENQSTADNNFERFYHLQQKIELGTEWQKFEIEFIPTYKGVNTMTGGHAPVSTLSNGFSIWMGDYGVQYQYAFAIDNIKLVAKDNTMEFNYLEANNIKAYIDPINSFSNWTSPSHEIQYFEVPKNSGKSTIFTTNLWLGGLDEGGNLYVAAQRFCQVGFDFWLGPISNDYTLIDEKNVVSDAFAQKYHHTWKVTKAEIEYHKAHYADPGYVMPWGIANWPAHGRPEHGESWELAPYHDADGNGWYTPYWGDYPLIRGDEAVFFIMNDKLNKHTESGSNSALGLEILGMAYAFNSPDETLQNTMFLSYVLRNKSANNYKDFYFGFFTDFDLGYAFDDFIGCDTLLNMMYVYNGTEVDGNGQSWAYGENPPAQGAMFLNQKMSAFVYLSNNASPTGDPNTALEYYNLSRAIWRDGTPMTMWGNGYNPSSTDYTKYMFTGDPVAGTGWIEAAPMGPGSYPNKPDDRRGLMSAGPFTLPVHKSLSMDIALPFARSKESKSSLSSLALLKFAAEEVQEYYEEHIAPLPFIGIKEEKVSNDKLRVYPNPSNGRFTIESKKVIESIELYDMLGKKVFTDTPKKQITQISTNLPQGLYIYRAVLQDNTTISGKIAVQ